MKHYIFLCLVLLLSACSSAPSESSIQTAIAQTQAAQPTATFTSLPTNTTNPISTFTVVPTNTPEPTPTLKPTKSPEPTSIPTPIPIGLGRSQPIPRTEIAIAPNWDIQVIEVKRGEEAWTDIQAANMFNLPAPEGMEYLLIKLHVKSKYTDNDAHSIDGCDFELTGDRLIKYTCSMFSVVEPDPVLDAKLFSGGETEGWVSFAVSQGEGNLILIATEPYSFDNDYDRFIAIDDGATINIPPELFDIKPNDLGKERNSPASKADTITTEDWELSVLEVIRGDEAWKKVQDANQYNDPPTEGMEYIAVKLKVRYIGISDSGSYIDGSYFNTTGSAGVLYDLPSVVDPYPQLDITLYPGGEFEGWVVVQAAEGETGISLIFNPDYFSDENQRFISLE